LTTTYGGQRWLSRASGTQVREALAASLTASGFERAEGAGAGLWFHVGELTGAAGAVVVVMRADGSAVARDTLSLLAVAFAVRIGEGILVQTLEIDFERDGLGIVTSPVRVGADGTAAVGEPEVEHVSAASAMALWDADVAEREKLVRRILSFGTEGAPIDAPGGLTDEGAWRRRPTIDDTRLESVREAWSTAKSHAVLEEGERFRVTLVTKDGSKRIAFLSAEELRIVREALGSSSAS
jgi:hypothetical protein